MDRYREEERRRVGSAVEDDGRVVERSERPIAHIRSENVDDDWGGWDVNGVVEGAKILANTLVLLLLLLLELVTVPVVNDIVAGACCNTPAGFSVISAPGL